MSKIVLSLCDYTGNMLAPWAAAGFRCIAVDIKGAPDSPHPGVEHVKADVSTYLPPKGEYAMVFAWPPCTDLAVSGARWFKDKGLETLARALPTVVASKRICEWAGVPWMLENPVGTLSTYWRKPDYMFDPCDYGGYLFPMGDAYTKKTCLWTGGGFVMPNKKWVEPTEGSKMHFMPPGEERAAMRSETPMGFAEAVFTANVKVYGPSTLKGDE